MSVQELPNCGHGLRRRYDGEILREASRFPSENIDFAEVEQGEYGWVDALFNLGSIPGRPTESERLNVRKGLTTP